MRGVLRAGIAVTFMTSTGDEYNALLAVSGSPSGTQSAIVSSSPHFPEGWRSQSTPGRIAGYPDSMKTAIEDFPRTCTH